MEENSSRQLKDVLAFITMAAVGAVLVILFGELAKHFIAYDTLYFSVINHVYLLAAAALLLFLGLGWSELKHIRNLTGFFLLLLIFIAVAYQADRIAIGSLPNSGALLISHVPEHYAQMFLTALDGIALIIGAAGAFMLLWKGLDKLKDVLAGTSKSS